MQHLTDHDAQQRNRSTVASTRRVRPKLALAIARLEDTRHERAADRIHRAVEVAALKNDGIDIQVGWDGEQAQFQVLTTSGQWVGLDNLAVSAKNSVIKPPDGERPVRFHARFRRADPHACCPFRVRIIPIVWQVEGEDEDARQQVIRALLEDPQFTAIRDQHYICEWAEESGYQPSTETDSVHSLSLELQVGRDYEVWVELQHPTDPSADWHVIDPLVTTGNSGAD